MSEPMQQQDAALRPSASEVALRIPEVLEYIILFVGPRQIPILRLVNRAFHRSCCRNFALSVVIDREHQEKLEAPFAKERGPLVRTLSIVFPQEPLTLFATLPTHFYYSNVRRLRVEAHRGSSKATVLWMGAFPRLQELVVDVIFKVRFGLDSFLDSLAVHPARKRLLSLEIINHPSSKNSIMWQTFVYAVRSIPNLRRLGFTNCTLLDVAPAGNLPSNASPEELKTEARGTALRVLTALEIQGDCPTLQALTLSRCEIPREGKLALLKLFPNVKDLTLNSILDIWSTDDFDSLFGPRMERFGMDAEAAVIFPQLTRLAVASAEDKHTGIFLDWLATKNASKRMKHFELSGKWNGQLVNLLGRYMGGSGVRLRSVALNMLVTRVEPLHMFLDRGACNELQSLTMSYIGSDAAKELLTKVVQPDDIIRRSFKYPPTLEMMSAEFVLERMPYAKTLTALHLGDGRSRFGTESTEVEGNLKILGQLLKYLPLLVDFSIKEPLPHLGIFHRIGRRPQAGPLAELALPPLPENMLEQETWERERPFLRTLSITLARTFERTRADVEEELYARFRFMEEIRIHCREDILDMEGGLTFKPTYWYTPLADEL